MKKVNTGAKPISNTIQFVLNMLASNENPTLGTAVVHHYTDTKDGLQLEVEYRHPEHGCTFKRLKMH